MPMGSYAYGFLCRSYAMSAKSAELAKFAKIAKIAKDCKYSEKVQRWQNLAEDCKTSVVTDS